MHCCFVLRLNPSGISISQCSNSQIYGHQIKFVKKGDDNNLASFSTIVGSHWGHRNKMIYEEKNILPHTSFKISLSLKLSYCKLGLIKTIKKTENSHCRSPPLGSFLKLNVNNAMFFDLNKTGIGAILRNSKGEVVMATSLKGFDTNSPQIIEVAAILRSL